MCNYCPVALNVHIPSKPPWMRHSAAPKVLLQLGVHCIRAQGGALGHIYARHLLLFLQPLQLDPDCSFFGTCEQEPLAPKLPR